MDFRKKAQEAVAGSFIMQGREAIKTEIVIASYPDGITVIGADMISTTDTKTGELKEYASVIYAEDDTHYMNGGAALTDIVRAWGEGFESYEEMSEALKQAGGVKIKMHRTTTKNGNNYTEVTVV